MNYQRCPNLGLDSFEGHGFTRRPALISTQAPQGTNALISKNAPKA